MTRQMHNSNLVVLNGFEMLKLCLPLERICSNSVISPTPEYCSYHRLKYIAIPKIFFLGSILAQDSNVILIIS